MYIAQVASSDMCRKGYARRIQRIRGIDDPVPQPLGTSK
jgi:hypothetical protein